MTSSLKQLTKTVTFHRIARGTGANAFGQAVTILIQLILVPTMAATWGINQYGHWLLLFAIPSYLSVSDLGFATAASTKMTMDVAAGRRRDALVTFHSAFVVISTVSALIAIAFATAIFLAPLAHFWNEIAFSFEQKWTLFILVIYGLVCLQAWLLQAPFRCSGNYAIGTFLYGCTQLAEGLTAIAGVTLGGSMLVVAFGYLLTRLLLLGVQVFISTRMFPWLALGFDHSSIREARDLLRPALAVMALPTAQGLFLQGSAIVLGVTVSPAAVANFTTVRTLTRSGVQFTTLVNNALMPEAAAAAALNQQQRLMHLIYVTFASSLAITVPVAIILLFFGTQLVELWTAHTILPGQKLLTIMIGVMIVNGIWYPLSNMLLAVNRQSSYSYVFLIAVILSLAFGFLLSRRFHEAGMAGSMLLLDVFMLQHVVRRVWSTFIVSREKTRHCRSSIS